ncbi:exodeoxyribonuclease VII small subunit [Geothrix fuzhouensis]|uniref:exodeoxyribonuclease VII small subunit n=1 Tax=Geothrix fuzhouensis TaxID=2966451 RepID=UPI00214992A4|nr:exodeoxyribonuclease VII small subunit [Geothrix fuzhouensis]
MSTQPSFDDGLDRLEALVQQLESGSLSLEEALARFEEGVQLSQALQKQLAEAQRRVEVLKAGLGGEYRADPLDDAKDSR